MPDLLEQPRRNEPHDGSALPFGPPAAPAYGTARSDLRRQIARLERELGGLFAENFPRRELEWGVGAVGGPRLLSIGDLERIRDALAARVRDTRAEIARLADVEEANRGLLEAMIAEPDRHRWLRISNEDIGETGCRHWHSRPRWGILGMMAGWWRIRLSSGCPLAEGLLPPLRQISRNPA